MIHQVLDPLLWTECCCPLNWCGPGTLLFGPCWWWQRCHQQTSSTIKGGLVMTVLLSFQNPPWRVWCRFLILLVESWRIVVISGTVHWLYLRTSFHPLLWTSSGLTGSWKLSTYIRFGSLRSVKVLKLRVKEAWKSVKSVKPIGN